MFASNGFKIFLTGWNCEGILGSTVHIGANDPPLPIPCANDGDGDPTGPNPSNEIEDFDSAILF